MTPPKKRILIVDESPTALVWQLKLLDGERYDTLTACHVAEGVRIAMLERPDLILFDVTLPRTDGIAGCRALRAAPETRHIPIVLVTSNGDIVSTLAGMEAGCTEFITKPFERGEYLVKIRSCLGRLLEGTPEGTPDGPVASSGHSAD